VRRETNQYLLTGTGWTVYILECADQSFRAGLTRNLRKAVADINMLGIGHHFGGHPERLPVKVVFKEEGLKFREAYAKYNYITEMARPMRIKLIKKKKWPIGGPLLQYVLTMPWEDLE
jgi:predicted GIY-YIG superfamily endonuclease